MSAVYIPTIDDQTKEHQSFYGYDDRHRLESITHQLCTISAGHACSSDSDTGSVSYEYDDSDNRTRVVEDNGSSSTDYRYCHDALNQLIGRGSTAACDTSSVESFEYDASGNRTEATEAGVERDFLYTADGLLCDVETAPATPSCTSGNVTSDDAGRISDVGGWHFEYDAEARLVSACENSSCSGSGFNRLDFGYDGEGHRIAITETPVSGSAVVWTFRYQGDAIVAEYKDGTLYREYVTDDAGTISKVIVPAGQTGTGSYLVTWNGHGDAMALYKIETSGSLTLANSYTYGTWGRPTTATHNSIADLGFRFLYVGAHDVQWDSAYGLDLLYMHARHYSPSLGRFLQPDPSRLDEQLFVYAGNGPKTAADPTGLISQDCRDLLKAIASRQNELVKRFIDIRQNPNNLPMYGRNSVAGHQQQFRDKQRNLRKLLRALPITCRGGGPKGGPPGAWKIATIATPRPMPKPVLNDSGKYVVSTLFIIGGVVVTIWWGAKVLSPACGPAAPACALVL